MTISRLVPPFDYMRAASRTSLQSFELARLNHAANLRREIAALIDQWIQERSEATMARWMLDHQDSLRSSRPSGADALPEFPDLDADPLPDAQPPPTGIVPAPPLYVPTSQAIRERITRKHEKQRSASQK